MNKTTVKLIIFLSVIALFLFGLTRMNLVKKLSQLDRGGNKLFAETKLKKVDRIEVVDGEEKTVFLKQNADWRKKEATQSAKAEVEEMISTVEEMQEEQLASTNPEKRKIFQVDEKNALQVILKNGDQQVVNFFIGKRGPDYLSTYLRKQGEDKVWLISESLKQIFSPQLSKGKKRPQPLVQP